MEWFVEVPTERGWYWVITNSVEWKDRAECVYIGYPEYDDRLFVYSTNPSTHPELLSNYQEKYIRHWLGPLPQPAPPPKDMLIEKYDWATNSYARSKS